MSSWTIQFAEKRYQYSATIGDRNGIINDRGEVLISIDYDASSSPFMMEEFRDLVVVKKDGLYGLCKLGLLKKPNEYFEKIYLDGGDITVVKDGKKMEAKITNGNFVTY